MSLAHLRRALATRGRTVRALLLSLGSVVALVVGLLSMHAMSSEIGHGEVRAQVAAVQIDSDAVQDAPAYSATDAAALCGLDCGTGDPLLLFACVLALLVTALTLLGPAFIATARMGPSLITSMHQRGRQLLSPTPSLTLLSISRT